MRLNHKLHINTLSLSGGGRGVVGFLLIVCMLLSFFASCKGKRKADYVIGVSQCSDDLWRQKMNREMQREISFFPETEVHIKTVKDDTQQQIKDIESFIEEGVDLLVISPNESSAITPIVQKAFNSGIPIILVDRKIDAEDYTAYMGADNYQIGRELGIYVNEILKKRGRIVEIRGWDGSTSDAERHAGFIDVIHSNPDLHIVAERWGNYLEHIAEKEMQSVLEEVKDIDLVFAMNDPMALGVYNAVTEHVGKRPLIIGIDALPGNRGGVQWIQNGFIDASFIYPTGGDKVIDLAMRILKGKSFARENTLNTAVVDKSNARIIQMQTEQLSEYQTKLDDMNDLLNKSMLQYSNQSVLFYGTILMLLVLSGVLSLVFFAHRSKSRSNDKLRKQTKVLEQQKEQLISLSEQLEAATQDKLVFFTNISHEFKTPLTLILGPVETLLTSENILGEEKNQLELIQRNTGRLLNLMSEIIEFRSYENGKMKTFFSFYDMKLFIEELIIPFYDYAKRKNINLVFKHTDNSFPMWFDKEKVEKIFSNLMSNALKYTYKYHDVKIVLSQENREGIAYVCLTMVNEGQIIPKDKIENIFERFYKVNPYDSGTGIGLALTKALVDVHNGKISVDSIEGVGSIFSVLLPLVQEQPDNVAHNDDLYYEKGYTENLLNIELVDKSDEDILLFESDEKPIILLIEDNPDVTVYLRMILNEDYTLIDAENGYSGIQKAIKYVPDVIISDVMMPGINGFEVCHKLKEDISTSHIPIILLTACSLDEQKAIGFESGADAYIPKPFNAELLKIRVRKLIENRLKIKQAFSNSLLDETKKTSLADIEQEFINDFHNYVIANISDPDMNVDNIAKVMGMSRVQLYRKLKSLANYSPIELVKIIRLKYAVQLLKTRSKSISEVAYESGFSSPSYFTKCFKEIYGESPTEYMK